MDAELDLHDTKRKKVQEMLMFDCLVLVFLLDKQCIVNSSVLRIQG